MEQSQITNHLVNALIEREALCMKFLCATINDANQDKKQISTVYNDMVQTAHERKLLQSQQAKN